MSILSSCCDSLPLYDIDTLEDGICGKCGEHTEFYDDESCPECDSPVENGVCQGNNCKGRLL